MDELASVTWPDRGRDPRALRGLQERRRSMRPSASAFSWARRWNYLCLEAEIATPGDYRATHVGDVPVIVARDMDGSLGAFENRCAHRGALICHKRGGNGARISCVYHGWTYDLKGNLTAVTFQRGIERQGRHARRFPARGLEAPRAPGRELQAASCSARFAAARAAARDLSRPGRSANGSRA